MFEERRHVRFSEDIEFQWTDRRSRSGEGKILNISQSGVLFEADGSVRPEDELILKLSVRDERYQGLVPQAVKVVWFKRIHINQYRFLCGAQFDHPSDRVMTQLSRRLNERWNAMAETTDANILKHYV